MKREGRQHGMVRTYQVRPPEFYRGPQPRYNRSDSPSTAGLFTKVSPKPTNHSKYTSKCRKPICNCCHNLPVCKSKTKSKGTQKLRLVDAQGLNLSGLSATLMLDHLTTDSSYYYFSLDEENDDHVEEEEEDEEVTNLTAAHSDHAEEEEEEKVEEVITNLTGAHHSDHVGSEVEEDVIVDSDEKDNNDNENMNYCDVGYVWEHVEDDGDWCLVVESMD
ncbi:uncharacterized protein LOC124913669 [Impatiens glandulifera]|uniref:uncharacterized protein LOC124913669 n=1 Tax=Impatiens glandulifera TaxID=253017 RepID=UPI001FB12CA2|nr:uncharacterized protein LOC124913669 [Impatiens glandulifera]